VPGPANSLNITQPGFQSFDGVSVFNGRTLTAGTGVSISNGDGIAGNPVIALSGGSAAVEHLTGDSGGILSPVSNNFNIVSDSNYNTLGGVGVLTGSGNTITLSLTRALSSPSPIGNTARNTALFTSLGSNAGQTFSTALNTYPVTSITATSTAYNSVNQVIQLNLNPSVAASVLPGFGPAIQMQSQNTAGSVVPLGQIDALFDNVTPASEASHLEFYVNNTGSSVSNGFSIYKDHVVMPKGQYVNVTTPGAYPYTTLISDFLILVDSSAARTITPLASPATGAKYVIKDNVGSAATNTITITPSGKNIDGAASATITSNYGSITIVYNGTQWNII
jgi:hypothetical protein